MVASAQLPNLSIPNKGISFYFSFVFFLWLVELTRRLLLVLRRQGVRPQSFDKVESNEIREIIDRCTRVRREERSVQQFRILLSIWKKCNYSHFFFRKNRIKKENNRPSVKDLLNDTEFFCKTRRNGSEGGRSALNEAMARTSKSVRFRLRVLAPKKRRDQHEENEMRRLRPSSSSSTQ